MDSTSNRNDIDAFTTLYEAVVFAAHCAEMLFDTEYERWVSKCCTFEIPAATKGARGCLGTRSDEDAVSCVSLGSRKQDSTRVSEWEKPTGVLPVLARECIVAWKPTGGSETSQYP